MALDISRRWFVAAASTLAVFPSNVIPPKPLHPFADALQNSIDSHESAISGAGNKIFEFFANEFDGDVDTSMLKSLLLSSIERDQKVLTELCRVTLDLPQLLAAETPVLGWLLEAEKTKLGFRTQLEMCRQDGLIEKMLKCVDVDVDTWRHWTDEFLSDDFSGLEHTGGLIDYNTGGLSHYFMDCMDSPAYRTPVPVMDAIRTLGVDLQTAFPVSVPVNRCSVLADIVRDTSGDPLIEELKTRLAKTVPYRVSFGVPTRSSEVPTRPPYQNDVLAGDDILSFRFHSSGRLIGNDVY